jgi:hypothetical protein
MIRTLRKVIRALRRLVVVALSLWAVALLAYYLNWFDPGTHQELGVGLRHVNGWAIDRLSWAAGRASQHIGATIDDLAKTLHEGPLAGLLKLGGLSISVVAPWLALYFYLKLRITRRAIRRLLNG